LWRSAVRLFKGKERLADPLKALELAKRYRLSAYDAQYLAVAIDLNVQLITEDRAISQAVPQNSKSLHEYLEQQQN
jgi:predicted nucleic acid-binding protein